jgi:pimeloyl-ACP methyl ester carboxylesterase
MPLRVFIHGLESSSQGNKGLFFRARYPDMLIEDFEGSLEKRMSKLTLLLDGKVDLILVGSSFGGLMAAIYTCLHSNRIRKLILLAPALDLDDFRPYTDRRIDIPVTIFHGKYDDVVPPDPVRRIAGQVFKNRVYHLVDDDHPLRKTFPTYDWDDLLDAKA